MSRPSRRRGDRRRVLSQNFLRDRSVATAVVDALGDTHPPVIELGAGDGALTAELVRNGHQVTAVELDPRWARLLSRRFDGSVRVVRTDMLRYRFPPAPYNVVSNVPYAITTPLLRTLFEQSGWEVAVLMVQWEVARKRTGGAGATLLTASWWPWYDVTLLQRVPARAFRPVPRVDSGLLRVRRLAEPLVPVAERRRYQRFVQAAFTGRGAGLAGVLRPYLSRQAVRTWADRNGVSRAALPRDLDARQWASLYRIVRDGRG